MKNNILSLYDGEKLRVILHDHEIRPGDLITLPPCFGYPEDCLWKVGEITHHIGGMTNSPGCWQANMSTAQVTRMIKEMV